VGESAQQPSPSITDVQDRQGGTAAVGHAGKRRPSLPDQTGMYETHDDAMGRPKRARRPPAHLADFVHRITCAVAVDRETSVEPPVFYSEISDLKVGIESNVKVNENERTIDSSRSDCCSALYCAATNCLHLSDSRSDEMDPVWTCGFDGCDRVYYSERGIRRHYILKHRHKYRRGQVPVYIHDDAEFERLRVRLRRGLRHRHRRTGSDEDDDGGRGRDGNGASRPAAPVSPAEAVYSSSVSLSANVMGGPQSRAGQFLVPQYSADGRLLGVQTGHYRPGSHAEGSSGGQGEREAGHRAKVQRTWQYQGPTESARGGMRGQSDEPPKQSPFTEARGKRQQYV